MICFFYSAQWHTVGNKRRGVNLPLLYQGKYLLAGAAVIGAGIMAGVKLTEFRMMLTLMIQLMSELPEGSDIVFLTNAAYIQNFDREPGSKAANPDLILQCIEVKARHSSVYVKIVPYHKSPLFIETHNTATEAMKLVRCR